MSSDRAKRRGDGRRSLCVRPLLPIVCLVALATTASVCSAPFLLDRGALELGEWWRVWTGHLVHATTAHFLFDVGIAGLLLLLLRRPWALFLLAPFVGLTVLWLRPDIPSYAGLSGVLHGLTVLVAVDLARRSTGWERAAAAALLVGVVAKAMLEGALGVSIFTSAFAMGDVTVYEAHLVGVLGGLLLAAWDACVRTLRARTQEEEVGSTTRPRKRIVPVAR